MVLCIYSPYPDDALDNEGTIEELLPVASTCRHRLVNSHSALIKQLECYDDRSESESRIESESGSCKRSAFPQDGEHIVSLHDLPSTPISTILDVYHLSKMAALKYESFSVDFLPQIITLKIDVLKKLLDHYEDVRKEHPKE